GKHAPLLYTERDGVPRSIVKYVESIQQAYDNSPMEAPYNHAWIIGDEKTLTTKLQSEIDEILENAAP
ncbi:cell wall-binding repeat-containing protein, partial [Paenibacillus glucanolyticus]